MPSLSKNCIGKEFRRFLSNYDHLVGDCKINKGSSKNDVGNEFRRFLPNYDRLVGACEIEKGNSKFFGNPLIPKNTHFVKKIFVGG